MEKINTIKEMYKEDRPYEKCEKFGAENLTDTELLAILIRTGTKGGKFIRTFTKASLQKRLS